MMKVQRPDPPQWLSDKYERWGQRYEQTLAKTPGTRFRWPQHEKQKINHLLLPLLRKMTDDHCSFCDIFQMVAEINETIEHFKPAAKYPRDVCRWENLFLCCNKCQGAKQELFNPKLLKPDEAEYGFARYFIYQFASGELQPNPAASQIDQQRAHVTITLYGLNAGERPRARKRVFESYCQSANPDLTLYSYRFMFL